MGKAEFSRSAKNRKKLCLMGTKEMYLVVDVICVIGKKNEGCLENMAALHHTAVVE